MDTKTITNDLIETQGVNGVSIMNKDGTVVDSQDFLETDNALIGFTGTAVNDATTMFTLGNAKKSVLKGPGYKILIIIDHDHYFGVMMDEDADEDIIEQKIETLVSAAA